MPTIINLIQLLISFMTQYKTIIMSLDEQPSSSTDRVSHSPQSRQDVCSKQLLSTRPRKIDLLYTDLFLNTFNYRSDLDVLLDDLQLDNYTNTVLLVLSPQLYQTIRKNENAVVLRDGHCFITTPENYGSIGDAENNPPPEKFDHVAYFNVDPFSHASPPTTVPVVTLDNLASTVRTPLVTTFDNYMTCPEVMDDTSVTVIFNIFLLRTDSMLEYERSRQLRVDVKPRILSVYSYEQDVISRTACNFCSDVVVCMQRNLNVYTIGRWQQVPSQRGLRPAVAENMFVADRLVMLDVHIDRGFNANPSEYYRFKQFYSTFAHDRKNKWGLVTSSQATLRTYLRRWNALLQEEMKRWYWVLSREAETMPPAGRPTQSELRLRVMQLYAMAPCILNGVNVDRDVCGRGETIRARNPPVSAELEAYLHDVLMPRYDTTSLLPGGDLASRVVVDSLLASKISINDELVAENRWPGSTLRINHNKFFEAFVNTT